MSLGAADQPRLSSCPSRSHARHRSPDETVCQADRSARGGGAHDAAREHERYERRRTLGSRSLGGEGLQNPIVMMVSFAKMPSACVRKADAYRREAAFPMYCFG